MRNAVAPFYGREHHMRTAQERRVRTSTTSNDIMYYRHHRKIGRSASEASAARRQYSGGVAARAVRLLRAHARSTPQRKRSASVTVLYVAALLSSKNPQAGRFAAATPAAARSSCAAMRCEVYAIGTASRHQKRRETAYSHISLPVFSRMGEPAASSMSLSCLKNS